MAGDGKEKSSLSDRFKNPFRDMKEALEDKLENSVPLRDAKIHLSHKKYVARGGPAGTML